MSAIATDPNLQYLHKARDQIARGDFKNATLTLNKAHAQWPQDPRAFLLAGVMAEKAGNIKGAFEALRRSAALAPDWGPGWLELALLLARQNQFQEAVEIAEKVSGLEPSNLQVLAGVVDIAHRAGHTEMAIRHLERGLLLVPGDTMLRRLLARDWSERGEHEKSIAMWSALVAQDPSDVASRVGHVQACIAAGKAADALPNTKVLLETAPDDAVYQYYAQLARGETPAQQPAELTRPLFDGMATLYDQHTVRRLKYQLPKQVADKIIARYPDKKLNVLDLGCGTGLLGVCLGRINGFLIGVDLSHKMIEQAIRHNVYDRFHTVDLHDALRETPDALYEVITALDVFIYTGDIAKAIADAFRILAAKGELVFSCETASEDGPDWVLLPAGRYAHKRSHVQALCQSAGFDCIEIEDTILRHENHMPVHGFVTMACKTTAAAVG